MLKITTITRVTDSLPLSADSEAGYEAELQKKVKSIVKTITPTSAPRCSIDDGDVTFHYIASNSVCFMTVADKDYPKDLAFMFLDKVEQEFMQNYAAAVSTATRPYQFIKFAAVMQTLRNDFANAKSQNNVERLNNELREVHSIMTTNLQEVLGRGEKLDDVSQMSSRLSLESKRYAKQAKYLNVLAMLRKWGPIVAIIFFVFALLYLRYKWFV